MKLLFENDLPPYPFIVPASSLLMVLNKSVFHTCIIGHTTHVQLLKFKDGIVCIVRCTPTKRIIYDQLTDVDSNKQKSYRVGPSG